MADFLDRLLIAILGAGLVVQFSLRFFVKPAHVTEEDKRWYMDRVLFPARILNPTGRVLRWSRDILWVLVLVLAIILVNVPYQK